jgi:bifunctional DNA-binding transcriptional regulator/antitoxin component of YhaV-PrlF toxin-antitoxin module
MIITVSERGQISIPAAARRKLSVEVGEKEIVIRPVKSILEVAGIFREYAKGKTTGWDTIREETMRIVAEEVMSETSE